MGCSASTQKPDWKKLTKAVEESQARLVSRADADGRVYAAYFRGLMEGSPNNLMGWEVDELTHIADVNAGMINVHKLCLTLGIQEATAPPPGASPPSADELHRTRLVNAVTEADVHFCRLLDSQGLLQVHFIRRVLRGAPWTLSDAEVDELLRWADAEIDIADLGDESGAIKHQQFVAAVAKIKSQGRPKARGVSVKVDWNRMRQILNAASKELYTMLDEDGTLQARQIRKRLPEAPYNLRFEETEELVMFAKRQQLIKSGKINLADLIAAVDKQCL